MSARTGFGSSVDAGTLLMKQRPLGTSRHLTATGRSAIATIRLIGDLTALDTPLPVFRAINRKRMSEQVINVLCLGVWGEPGEDVVLCRTSERSVEVTCHGGSAAVARILEDASGRGFSGDVETSNQNLAPDWEPLALDILLRARTGRTAEILLEQVNCLWPQFALDLPQLSNKESRLRIDDALEWSEFGRHLVEPWNVVLCGRPNVGKSSLMNALAGFTRSIVSEHSGTTRDLVTLETAIEGWPVRITDTAGIRETTDSIEQAGVTATRSAIDYADLVVIVLDASEPLQPVDQHLLNNTVKRRLIVAHKSDLPPSSKTAWPVESLQVSSASGQGVEALLQAIARALVPALPPQGQLIPLSMQHISELQRLPCFV